MRRTEEEKYKEWGKEKGKGRKTHDNEETERKEKVGKVKKKTCDNIKKNVEKRR